MPRSLIVYFSPTATTARVAEAIAAGLRSAEYQVDLCNMKEQRAPDPGGYDLLGIGSPVYFYRPPFHFRDYLNGLPQLNGLPAFTFVLHGTYRGDTGTVIRQMLAGKGAKEVGYFHCRGADYFQGYLKQGYLFSPGHPTAEELYQAKAFGGEVAAHVAGKQYARPAEDSPPRVVYRLERFLSNRWLARHVYRRLFTVDKKKCTICGVCFSMCPTANITEGEGKYPRWGRNCLLCLTCQLKCPEDAIGSLMDWLMFRPFLIYNVRNASRDPSLDHARVTQSKGYTRLV